jgi:hypothetical protein
MRCLVCRFDPVAELAPVPVVAVRAGPSEPRRCGPLGVRVAFLVLDAADVNPQESVSAGNALFDIVIDEFSRCGFRPDQDHGDACAFQAFID